MGRGQGPRPTRHLTTLQYRQRYAKTIELIVDRKYDVRLVASILGISLQAVYQQLKKCKIPRIV